MALAYAYAEGDGPEPDELIAGRLVDRFGAAAVYGRPLGYGELKRMLTAENIVNAYRARDASANWAQWATENPELNRLLNEAMSDGD